MAVNVYRAVKQAMQDLVAPQLESLRADINTVASSVNGLRVELNGLRAETAADLGRLDERLTIALDVRKRLAR